MRARRRDRWGKTKITLVVAATTLFGACATPQRNVAEKPTQPATAPTTFVRPPPAATPEQTALRTLTAQQDRLYNVAAPLLTNNTTLCRGNARNLLGFTAKNKYSYPPEFANVAQSVGFDDRLQVTGVLPGSGADKSGVQRGDILLAVANKPLQQGPDAERQAATQLGPLMNGRTPIKLTLLRNKTQQNLVVPLTMACAFSIELGNADNVNTYGDGRRVLITRGMLNFVRSDEELAYLIAKEMAHNSLGHAIRQRMVATMGSVIDNQMRAHPEPAATAGAGGIRPYPQELDAAADTTALYMLVRSGYQIDNYAAFWQRLATQYPASVPNGYTALHPATSYRMTMIDKSVQTLKAKQASGAPMTP